MSTDIEMTVSEYTDSDSEYFPSDTSFETDTSLDTIYPEEIEDLYKELEEDACFVPELAPSLYSFLYAHE
jgi:hypothetical protein